jgi:hypothetical protein
VGVKAQNVSSQDVIQKKKEINQVKLGEDAVYAEVIEMVTGDDDAISLAQQKSIDKLQINVIEACAAKMKMSREDVKEIFDVIDDKCQNITINAGDIIRVFSYISKDAIGLTRRKPKEKDIEEIFGPDYLNKSYDSDNLKKKESIKSKSELKLDSVLASTSKEEVKLESVSDPVVLATPKVEPKVEPKLEPKPESKSVEVPTPEPVVKVEPVVEVVVPDLCQTMISKGNMTELMRYLNQEKKYQRLMYGNRNSMQFLDKCYIVIIDKGSQGIVTVLDKGTSERMNFVSKQMDSLANYRGGNYAAIYVQEY